MTKGVKETLVRQTSKTIFWIVDCMKSHLDPKALQQNVDAIH
jgi:hypothetical protein